MGSSPFRTVLVDYDETLFTPPEDVAETLAVHGIEWVMGRHHTPEEALEAARDADVAIVQTVRQLLTGDVIRRLPRCKCIVRLGVGYDTVDVAAATEEGILVCNAPNYCSDDVAEHALALLMDTVRHTARLDRSVRAGEWDRTKARPVCRLAGRTLGLIAFGAIARQVAMRVAGFGMTVLAYDPYVDAGMMSQHGVRKVDLEELLREADLISVHAPLTRETYHLISREQFGLMKEGVHLVNTSRGPVVDEEALAEALRSGKVWGAGLDVMESEPLAPGSPLRLFDNVTFTPHTSSCSAESVVDLYRIACQIAIDVHNGRWPEQVVNPEVGDRARVKRQG